MIENSSIPILIIYSFVMLLIALFLNVSLKKNVIKIILLTIFSVNSVSFAFYSGFGKGTIPQVIFFSIGDFVLFIAYMIARTKFHPQKRILYILIVYLLLNIVKTTNYHMYLVGIIRGVVLMYMLYSLLIDSEILFKDILKYFFYSIVVGYFLSLLAVMLVGYNIVEAYTSPALRAAGVGFKALGGGNVIASIFVFLIPLYIANKFYKESLVLFFFLLTTMSRSGILLGVAGVLLSILLLKGKSTVKILYISIFVIIVLLFADSLILSRLDLSKGADAISTFQNQDTALARYRIWDNTISFFSNLSWWNQITGAGYCTFKNNIFIAGLYDGRVSSPHSLGLSILYNYGYLGVLFFVIAVIYMFKQLLIAKLYFFLLSLLLFLLYGFLTGTVLLPEFGQNANFYILTIVLFFFVIHKSKINPLLA